MVLAHGAGGEHDVADLGDELGILVKGLVEVAQAEEENDVGVLLLEGSQYLFGWIMNLWYWLLYIYPHTLQTLGFVIASSVWFDTLHAIGNAIFLLILGEKTIIILKRYKNRFHIEYTNIKQKPAVSSKK